MSPRFSLSEVFLRTQSDGRLCGLAADGRQMAFAVLVQRHQPALTRTAMRLHQVVRSTALNHIARERGATEPLPEHLADPVDFGTALDERQSARELLACIAALPERQRTALVQTEFAGRSRRELASDFGVSEGSVRALVHRARSAVRVAMSALTPYPLAGWISRRSSQPGLLEALAGGAAGGGGVLLKGGAVLMAAGALGGGLAWRQLTAVPAPHRPRVSSHRAPAAERPRLAAAVPVSVPATSLRTPASPGSPGVSARQPSPSAPIQRVTSTRRGGGGATLGAGRAAPTAGNPGEGSRSTGSSSRADARSPGADQTATPADGSTTPPEGGSAVSSPEGSSAAPSGSGESSGASPSRSSPPDSAAAASGGD